MNNDELTQTIVTGSDPRGLPEFSAIREKSTKPANPSSRSRTGSRGIAGAGDFKTSGVDSHTASLITP